jgi:prophage regulatory protein
LRQRILLWRAIFLKGFSADGLGKTSADPYVKGSRPNNGQEKNMHNMSDEILRLPEVIRKTGKCRSGIYAEMKVGRFPLQKKIGKRAVGWSSLQIQDYIRTRLDGKEYFAG